MTKSKTEPVMQIAGAVQNSMAILALQVANRGGNLTEALVRLGTREARYENSFNLIAGELAAISAVPATEILAPEGVRVHTVQVNFNEAIHWIRAINDGFPDTRIDARVRDVGHLYRPKKRARFVGRIITLVDFGKDLSENDVLTWGKERKLIPADPRALWALGAQEPRLHKVLGLHQLAIFSLQKCFLQDRIWYLPFGLWGSPSLRAAELMSSKDVFSSGSNYYAFEKDPSA